MRVEENINNKLNKESGVSFDGVIEVGDQNDTVLRYLINGIIMFFITYGCMGCFVSSFSISCIRPMLFFILFVLSIAYSFMHINATAHKIGYMVILVSYMYVIFSLKTVIKSGFARIVNETFKRISDVIYVSKVRRYTEYVDDYKLAATLCLIIIGFVLLLILNIVISEYLNVVVTLLMTAPIVGAGFYFGYNPSMLPLIMYIVAVACLIVLRSNSKVNVHNTQVTYNVDKEDTSMIYELSTVPKMHAQIMLVIIVVASVLSGIFTLQLNNKEYSDSAVMTAVKSNLNDKLGKLISYNKEEGNDLSMAGGLSEGRLGDVPSIQFDNKDDLVVNFVPTSDKTVYLKGYVGSSYKDNRWYVLSEMNEDKKSGYLENYIGIAKIDRVNYTTDLLTRNYGKGYNNKVYKMTVTNVGAAEKFVYTPYYAQMNEHYMDIIEEDEIRAVNKVGRYEHVYFPFDEKITDTSGYNDIVFDEETYTDFVKSVYTKVPKKNKAVLDKLCKEEGFTNKEGEAITKVIDYFKKSYVYSTKCGTTPEGEDFVNYFIENKKGFCAHFATTGALILRNLGIPTRYVEGYVISKDMVDNAKQEGLLEDFILGDSSGNKAKPVEVRVTDSKAHAWIEVYKEGFGWVPYEMTYYNRIEDVASDDKKTTREESFFRTLTSKFRDNINKTLKKVGKNIVPLLLGTLSVIVVLALVLIVRLIVSYFRRKKDFNTSSYSENVKSMSKYLFKVCEFLGCKREKGTTIDEYLSLLYKEKLVSKDMLRLMSTGMKKVNYSNIEITKEEYIRFKEYIENIVEIQYNDLSLKDKLIFKIVYNL